MTELAFNACLPPNHSKFSIFTSVCLALPLIDQFHRPLAINSRLVPVMAAKSPREALLTKAKLAEQIERYDGELLEMCCTPYSQTWLSSCTRSWILMMSPPPS